VQIAGHRAAHAQEWKRLQLAARQETLWDRRDSSMETETVSSLDEVLCKLQPRLLRHLKPSGYVWLHHIGQCPKLQKFIESFKQDTVQKAAIVAKQDLRIKPNLLLKERRIIRTVLNRNVGYNNSDKNFGPVLMPKKFVRW
jgi:hypothetical protein